MNFKILFLAIFFSYASCLFAQEIEQLDDESGTFEMEIYDQEMDFFVKNKLNINQSTAEQLRKFPLFSEEQIQEIIVYRIENEGFVELNELCVLPSFSVNFVQKISPYLVLSFVEKMPFHPYHLLVMRTRWSNQKSTLYKDTLHGIDQAQLYIRYQGTFTKNWQIGFVAEKDQKEDFFQKTNPQGFDYQNAYVQYQGKKLVQQVILGTYRLQLGQGLLYWNSWALGKSNYVSSLEKKGYPLLPYFSANETNALQGIATKIGKNNWEMILFYSQKKRDARIENDQILTIYQTGLHQTPSEKARKHTLTEQIIGSNFQFRYQHWKLGTTISWQHYAFPFVHSDLYTQKYLTGKSLQNTSFYYQYQHQKFTAFAEYVYQSHQKQAFLQGITWKPNSFLTYTNIYRNYQTGFFSLYANAFSEASTPQNERGFYQGMNIFFHPKWELQAYTDFYEFPFFRYQVNFPTKGYDYVAQLRYNISSTSYLSARYKIEKKEESQLLMDEKIASKIIETNEQVRLVWQVESGFWKFQTNLNYHFYKRNLAEKGYLLSQTIQYKFRVQQRYLKLTYRMIHYTTPSFQTAIYAYEHDVLYTFSFPFYYGQGIRQYLVLRYPVASFLKIDLKIGYQQFTNGAEYRQKWDCNFQLISEF